MRNTLQEFLIHNVPYTSLNAGRLHPPDPTHIFHPTTSSQRFPSSRDLSHPFVYDPQFPFLPFIPRCLPASDGIFSPLSHDVNKIPVTRNEHASWAIPASVIEEWTVLEEALFEVVRALYDHAPQLQLVLKKEELAMNGPYRWTTNFTSRFPFRYHYRTQYKAATSFSRDYVTRIAYRSQDAFRALIGLVHYAIASTKVKLDSEYWKQALIASAPEKFTETWVNSLDNTLSNRSDDAPLLGTILSLPTDSEAYDFLQTNGVPIWFKLTRATEDWANDRDLIIERLHNTDQPRNTIPIPESSSLQWHGEGMKSFFERQAAFAQSILAEASDRRRQRASSLQLEWSSLKHVPDKGGNPSVFLWEKQTVNECQWFWIRRLLERREVAVIDGKDWQKLGKAVRFDNVLEWFDVWFGWAEGMDYAVDGLAYDHPSNVETFVVTEEGYRELEADSDFDNDYDKHYDDFLPNEDGLPTLHSPPRNVRLTAYPNQENQVVHSLFEEEDSPKVLSPNFLLHMRLGGLPNQIPDTHELVQAKSSDRDNMLWALGNASWTENDFGCSFTKLFHVVWQIMEAKELGALVPVGGFDLASSYIDHSALRVTLDRLCDSSSFPRKLQGGGYVIDPPRNSFLPSLYLPSATTALYCLREAVYGTEVTLGSESAIPALADLLATSGTAFRYLIPAPYSEYDESVRTFLLGEKSYWYACRLGSRTKGWEFGREDYFQWLDECRSALRNPMVARQAGMKGGLMWRLSIAFAPDTVAFAKRLADLREPGFGNTRDDRGVSYFDRTPHPSLSDLICGKYLLRSKKLGEENPGVVWLWPSENHWVSLGCWTSEKEKWFRTRADQIFQAISGGNTIELKSGKDWSSSFRKAKMEKKLGTQVEELSKLWIEKNRSRSVV